VCVCEVDSLLNIEINISTDIARDPKEDLIIFSTSFI